MSKGKGKDPDGGADRSLPANAMPVKQITIPAFGYRTVPQPDGGCLLVIEVPNGETYVLPFDEHSRKDLGNTLAAPGIVVPGAGGLPGMPGGPSIN